MNNVTTSLAAIKSTQQTQATTISALSQQQTNLTAQVGGQSAELQELKKTVVENGNVNSTGWSKWKPTATVKVCCWYRFRYRWQKFAEPVSGSG
ncbi:hypothetical protein H7U18_26520 [Klebsiella pneumoniae]|uniref:Gp24 n=1 Tax=Klebsiella pneumoniae TaxID=573 RepID=A0A923EML9_KLEPN|nr:hypothetical protein [Klebsiella pneumoniae]